jgi:hypothetical protein
VTVIELEVAEPALGVTVLGLRVTVLGLEFAVAALGGGIACKVGTGAATGRSYDWLEVAEPGLGGGMD